MAEEIYEEIMAKHFTKWIKDVNSQIQETLKIPAVKKKKKIWAHYSITANRKILEAVRAATKPQGINFEKNDS